MLTSSDPPRGVILAIPIGLLADDDGLFAAAGHQLARGARSGIVLFLGVTLMVGVVTATLNLDTSVAFLTPVLVYTAKSRGAGEAPHPRACRSPTTGLRSGGPVRGTSSAPSACSTSPSNRPAADTTTSQFGPAS